MTPTLEVLSPGTLVTVAGDIEGWIEAVRIGDNKTVTYRVVWWNARTRCCEQLQREEFEVRDQRPTTRIGFVATEGGGA